MEKSEKAEFFEKNFGKQLTVLLWKNWNKDGKETASGIFSPPVHKVEQKRTGLPSAQGGMTLRRVTAAALLMLLIVFLLPVLLIRGQPLERQEQREQSETQATLPIHRVTREPETETQDAQHTLSVQQEDGTIRTMTVEEYLWGVVAAEMPAAFELEALKAQAVAARTYCMSEETTCRAQHPLAQVCMRSACCQAYITREEAEFSWGDQAQYYTWRIEQAIAQTDGLGVLYQGQPIQALYFSSAPGQTVDAQHVWSRPVAYLVSVASPEGEEVPEYRSELTLPAAEVRELLLARYPDVKLSGKAEKWFSDFARDPAGTVTSVKVGGLTLKGGEVRKLLGLRSACFTLSVAGDRMTFQTVGYGHGVGMSQYGANAMAQEGKNFREILEWYYTGAQVDCLWQDMAEY